MHSIHVFFRGPSLYVEEACPAPDTQSWDIQVHKLAIISAAYPGCSEIYATARTREHT